MKRRLVRMFGVLSTKAVLTLVAAAVLAAVMIASASASFRGEPGQIAFDFWSGTSQSQDIGVINADGTGRTALTSTPLASEQTPRWSRDGKKIVYMRRLEPLAVPLRPPDIWVMDADGSNQTQLTSTPLGEFVPAWTADGRIVFCGNSGDAGGTEIYLMNADGSGRLRLTNSPGLDCWPAPAPIGNKVSFTSERNGYTQIFTMKLDGTNVRQVTSGAAYNWASDWSPSGNDLVFVRENVNDPADTDIWMAHSNGTGERQLTSDGADRPEAFPTWSPDGTKVVFGGIVASGVFNVFSVDPLTGDEQTLIEPTPPESLSVAYPSWQAVDKP